MRLCLGLDSASLANGKHIRLYKEIVRLQTKAQPDHKAMQLLTRHAFTTTSVVQTSQSQGSLNTARRHVWSRAIIL